MRGLFQGIRDWHDAGAAGVSGVDVETGRGWVEEPGRPKETRCPLWCREPGEEELLLSLSDEHWEAATGSAPGYRYFFNNGSFPWQRRSEGWGAD